MHIKTYEATLSIFSGCKPSKSYLYIIFTFLPENSITVVQKQKKIHFQNMHIVSVVRASIRFFKFSHAVVM